jgi:hypothetical protein
MLKKIQVKFHDALVGSAACFPRVTHSSMESRGPGLKSLGFLLLSSAFPGSTWNRMSKQHFPSGLTSCFQMQAAEQA